MYIIIIMKISSGLLTGIVVLCIIVFFTLMMASRAVSPYNAPSMLQGASFEGFNGMSPSNYSTYPNGQPIDNSTIPYNINSTAAQNNYQPLWGFNGLFGPASIPDNSIDIYANAPGSLSTKCQNVSSNLTNSMGHLCLDANQLTMLRTRGGNQTACSSQVGTCTM